MAAPFQRALVAGLCLSVVSIGCSSRDASITPEPPCEALRVTTAADVNVVVVVNDTMRRDRVGAYGGPARTPAFDAFANENVRFARAFTNAPWTKPAIATMFTSLYPSQHGLVSHPEFRSDPDEGDAVEILGPIDVLGDGYTTLAEVLRGAGYRTAAFVSNPWMARPFGFDQGFEVYDDSLARWGAPGGLVSERGLEWIASLEPGEKFFLYLHYIDSHRPYGALTDADVESYQDALANDARPQGRESQMLFAWLLSQPHQRLSGAALERLVGLGPSIAFVEMAYDRGIEVFDGALGGMLRGLAEHPAFDRTAVVVTSDHGEALFERGYGNHGTGLFDDEAAIPMAARLPGVSATRSEVDCAVSLIDLLPTVCTYLGVRCPVPLFGRSFITADDGPPSGGGYVVTEAVVAKPKHRTLRNGTWKLFWEPEGSPAEGPREYSLFDLGNDPGERHDLLAGPVIAPEIGRIAQELAGRLQAAVPRFERPEAERARLEPALERRLRALGYLQ